MVLGRRLEGSSEVTLNEVLNGGGFSRPSRYEVLLLPPRGSGNNPTSGNISNREIVRKTSIACENISFPGRNIDTTTDTNIYGPTREIASGFSYADISATFRCSSDMKEKLYFETWQRQSFNAQTWSMQYYEDYIGAVQIFQLDEKDKRVYGVELVEAFPKTIGAMALDYSNGNEIHKLSVTFSYRWWKNLNDEADLPVGIQESYSGILENSAERTNYGNQPTTLKKLFT